MTKDLKFSKEARTLMASGIRKLYDAVRVTLGPKGRNVIIEQQYGGPIIVNDGDTIAKAVSLKNKYENLGASVVIEAATKTNDVVGDGTTTATVLASVLIFEGLGKIDNGTNPSILKRGLDYLAPIVLKKIDEQSIAIKNNDDLRKTAINSSNSEEIGQVIYEAFMEVGKDGIITVQESKDISTHLDITKGYGFDRGYVSSYMVNDTEKMVAGLDNPLLLITDKKIIAMQEIVWALEHSMKTGRPLVIIADDIEQEVLGAIIVNKLRGVFNAVVVRAPGYGDQKLKMLEDLSIITKATFLDSRIGIDPSQATPNDLGGAAKVIISKDQTTIIDGFGDDESITSRINSLKTGSVEFRPETSCGSVA